MRRYIIILALLLATLPAAARTVYPLNEGWQFFFKYENSSDNARIVSLPHTWNSDAAGRGSTFLQTAATYQNNLYIPAAWRGKRLFVKFYGVQSVADVLVNGRHAGEHRGGATAFTIEITDKVRYDNDNLLRVDVSNTWQNDVLPLSPETNLYGGIYRNVELIVTDPTAVSPLYLGSEGVLMRPKSVSAEQVEGETEVHLTSATAGASCTVTLEITAPDGYQSFVHSQKARIDGKPVMIPFSIEKPTLWSPESPLLYTVTVRVEGDNSSDQVVVKTGFRDIRITANGGLLLNGKRLNIKGVSLAHDNINAAGAYTEGDYDTDMNFIRDLGANAIRSTGMPHAPYLYDLCDREGLLAWIELPFVRAPFIGDIAYYPTSRLEENGRQQLREMIAQNINHPSAAMWGIFSSLRMYGSDDVLPYIRSLNQTARTMDPSRPTVACSNQDGEINFITDLIVWQQNVGWDKGSTDDVKLWSNLLRKNWSKLRSAVAYGAEGLRGHRNLETQGVNRINYLPESRQTLFHEGYAKHLDSDSLFWGVWINNLFDYGSARRPYGINASGLVSFDRREVKDAYYLYRALWNSKQSTLHLAGKRRATRPDEPRQFKIYANQRPVLRVNGDTIALREWAPCQYRSDSVVINGKCKVEVSAAEQTDVAEISADCSLKPRQPQGLLRKADPRPIN